MGMGAVAGATLGGAALSAGASLLGSSKASSASSAAAQAQLEMYQQTRSDLSPYNTAGQSALSQQESLAGQNWGSDWLNAAGNATPGSMMTQEDLTKTPGYQFNLSQGLKAAQSAAAARGLGVSGASLKGAATYATGLADSTYQNQYNNAQTQFQDLLNMNTAWQGNQQNMYNRYSTISTLGENAAAQTGAQGTSAASTYGNYLNQSGLASAAGTTGASSALTSGVNNYLGYNMLSDYLKTGGGTGGYGTGGYTDPSNLSISGQ